MHVSIRRYSSKDLDVTELKKKIEANFLPIVSKIEGFNGYYAIDCGANRLATISIFDTKEGELKSNEEAAKFVSHYFEGRVARIELIEGSVLTSHTAALAHT